MPITCEVVVDNVEGGSKAVSESVVLLKIAAQVVVHHDL